MLNHKKNSFQTAENWLLIFRCILLSSLLTVSVKFFSEI